MPLALDGLFGWACYLLLGLFACAILARVQSRAADTRALLVPALAVAPFVMAAFWLLMDVAAVASRPLAATIAALIYLVCLAVRVLGAAYGPVRLAPVLTALVLILSAPWALEQLNLDTRLWVAEQPAGAASDAAHDRRHHGADGQLAAGPPSALAGLLLGR